MMMRSAGGMQVIVPSNWQEMTPHQKRKWRLDNFLRADGVNFVSHEAKNAYQIRAKRLVDVFNVEEPDRVPYTLPIGNLPYKLDGVSVRTTMYEYDKAVEACKRFNEQYSSELEYFASPFSTPGKIMDILDYKLYYWPGHGLPESAPGVQFIEAEYMKVEEYQDLILDPSDFWFRKYLPRVFGAFEPFSLFQPVTNMIEIVSLGQLATLGSPQMQDALEKMIEVGKEYQRMGQALAGYAGWGPAHGFPVTYGAFAKAPFDTLGDTLRGTAQIMKDMYRRPDLVLEACDKIADLTIASVLKSPATPRIFMVTYPLHKGADGWMSNKQFNTFYWPSLKKVMDALIKEGLIQNLFAEGAFNTRLESVNDFPKGTVTWLFDQTDMAKAKRVLGDKCCIQGNVPSSLVVTGRPEDVNDYCRKLIETCGKGGGYLLAAGAVAENPRLENVKAMVEAVREFGIYKK